MVDTVEEVEEVEDVEEVEEEEDSWDLDLPLFAPFDFFKAAVRRACTRAEAAEDDAFLRTGAACGTLCFCVCLRLRPGIFEL